MEALVKTFVFLNQFCWIKRHSLCKSDRDEVFARLIVLSGCQECGPSQHIIGKK